MKSCGLKKKKKHSTSVCGILHQWASCLPSLLSVAVSILHVETLSENLVHVSPCVMAKLQLIF